MRSLIGAFALLAAATAFADLSLDPVPTRNLRSVAQPFLRPTMRGSLLGLGRSVWSADLSVTNDVRTARDGSGLFRVREDAEWDVLRLAYRRGIGRGWEIGAELPLFSRGGGFLDPFLDSYHRVLGLSGTTREGVPYGRSEVIVDGRRFGSASGLGDLALSATRGFGDRLTVRGTVELPTGRVDALFGNGRVDAALDANYRTPFGRSWTLWTQIGAAYNGGSSVLPNVRPWTHVAGVSLVYRANSRDRIIGQWHSEESPFSVGARLNDDPHRVVTLAYRRQWSASALEAYFMEDGDFVNYGARWFANLGPDVSFGLRYVLRF